MNFLINMQIGNDKLNPQFQLEFSTCNKTFCGNETYRVNAW